MNLKETSFCAVVVFLLLFLISPMLRAQDIVSETTLNLSYMAENQRLGIAVNIGNAARTENYIFDTGSPYFISVYSSGAPWWGNFVDTGKTGTVAYGPGSGEVQYTYDYADASISVSDGVTTLNSPSSYPVDQVTSGQTNSDPSVSPQIGNPIRRLTRRSLPQSRRMRLPFRAIFSEFSELI